MFAAAKHAKIVGHLKEKRLSPVFFALVSSHLEVFWGKKTSMCLHLQFSCQICWVFFIYFLQPPTPFKEDNFPVDGTFLGKDSKNQREMLG